MSNYIHIPAGKYLQGSRKTREQLSDLIGGDADAFELFPAREITIANAFEMSAYEVTVGEWRRFVAATGYVTSAERLGGAYGAKLHVHEFTPGLSWRDPGFEQTELHPVACATYEDACAYCLWLSNETGRAYRLPSDAEWEYACRAGVETEYTWGDRPGDGQGYINAADLDGSVDGGAWRSAFPFTTGYRGTSPVGTFKPNAWGLYDMLGNVWEWCSDELPDDGRGKTRVVRGGSWRTPPLRCRCAFRNPDRPAAPFVCHGIRLVRE